MTNTEPAGDLGETTNEWPRKLLAVTGLVLSTLFLLNLTLGIVEIPDNLPIIGNIDEVLASGVFFACLSQLGINVLPFYRTWQDHQARLGRGEKSPRT